MLLGVSVLTGATGPFAGEVLLDHDLRHRRRTVLTTTTGTSFLLDLPGVPDLREGDAIVLSDGTAVQVRAAPEDLMAITCADPVHLARIAWHLGNRHLPTAIHGSVIHIRADHVIGAMVEGLGGQVRALHAPFDPERGAYATPGGHGHAHGHYHDDDHDHDHDHARGAGHGHHHHHHD